MSKLIAGQFLFFKVIDEKEFSIDFTVYVRKSNIRGYESLLQTL